MAGNSIGHLFSLTTFGESHGTSIGGVIDGCPAGVLLDFEKIQYQLDRRKPGQSKITTQRKESDVVQFLSGVLNGQTTGTPIGFIIPNDDQKSKDYTHLEGTFRPSHADYTYEMKYGIRDVQGGGRSSARETACRVVAGAIAQQILEAKDIFIHSYVSSVGEIQLTKDPDFSLIDSNIVRCPDKETADEMIEHIAQVKKDGDTIGGVISCVVKNCPVGLGAPVFNKLHADLGKAMLSINAVKGFEIGSGFAGTKMRGSEHNDEFIPSESGVTTKTNLSGGVQGGISNGQDITFNVAFKPVATLMRDQDSVDKAGSPVIVKGKGRHDPCVVPRAVPIVDAMAAITILDHLLLNQTIKIDG